MLRKGDTSVRQVLFLCVSNRNRSIFAEMLLPKLLREKGYRLADRVKVTSGGFVPLRLAKQLTGLHISFPEPFYGRPVAEATRSVLLTHGIIVPEVWRSREVTGEMLNSSDIVIVALPELKNDLSERYPHIVGKVFTIREIACWTEYLLLEDSHGPPLPLDDSFWNYVEENQPYVSAILAEMENLLVRAVPNILERLG